MLVRALPYDAPLWAELQAAEDEAKKAKPDEIRDRRAAFEARNRRASEVTDG